MSVLHLLYTREISKRGEEGKKLHVELRGTKKLRFVKVKKGKLPWELARSSRVSDALANGMQTAIARWGAKDLTEAYRFMQFVIFQVEEAFARGESLDECDAIFDELTLSDEAQKWICALRNLRH